MTFLMTCIYLFKQKFIYVYIILLLHYENCPVAEATPQVKNVAYLGLWDPALVLMVLGLMYPVLLRFGRGA